MYRLQYTGIMEKKMEVYYLGEIYAPKFHFGIRSGARGSTEGTLPETNMETQKGPYEDYSPSKRGLYGFPC